MIRLRPIDPARDYPGVAALIASSDPNAASAEAMLAERRAEPEGTFHREMAAVTADGTIAGCSTVLRFPWWGPGRFHVGVVVDPALFGQGIGSALYRDAADSVLTAGGTRLGSSVSDNDPGSLRFAESRGFRVDRHLFASTLDLSAFDPAPFAGVVDAVRAAGIRFFTMADVGDTTEARLKLYAVNRSVTLDIPGREPTFSAPEQYLHRVCGADWYRPDAQLVAADGDQWAGIASLQPLSAPGALFNRITGVVKDYRGRHIALALKLLSIDYALQHGYRTFKTGNDSENAPMLAINRKLGYQPQPGTFQLISEVR